MDALRQNDFEAYKELLRQTHGPQTEEDRFKGKAASAMNQHQPHSAHICTSRVAHGAGLLVKDTCCMLVLYRSFQQGS